ncbi:hypothetical protein RB195_002851 [Necator americanus]
MAVFLHLISIFLVLLQNSFGHKLVLFVPCIANSQVIFNSRVAETLANAGHDVTMVMITPLDGFDFKRVKIKKEIRADASVSTGGKYVQQEAPEGISQQEHSFKMFN